VDPAQDPFYRLHQLQAERFGEAALPYEQFRAGLVKTDSTNINLLVLPPVDTKFKSSTTTKARFNLGSLCIREDVADAIPADEILTAVERHAAGDSGLEKWQRGNERALRKGGWIISAYRSGVGQKFWIVTMPDRAMTAVVFRRSEQ
jgi:hypothetical protein